MDSRSRKNWRGKTRWAKWGPPLLLAAVAALWLALPTPPAAHAQEATASCGSGPLDGRTQKVVDAILAKMSETDCSAVTTADLNGVTGILRVANSLSSVQSDDFDDLTSLKQLNLYDNDLAELPSGVFDGLSSMTHLRIYNNDLTTLPDGVFDETSSLANIRLNNNQLEWLPPDLFEGLPLETLHLENNPPLACIHASQFDGLSNLRLLRMQNTKLGNINPTHFTRWNLTSLADLRFGDVRIAEANTFDVDFATYQAVLPALVEDDFRVEDVVALTDPICDTLERLAECGGASNPLHRRTQKVVDKIVAEQGASDCADVTTAQLEARTTLDLNNLRLHALRNGDFANFTGLQNLYLSNNKLAELPEDVFDGLTGLQILNLYDNSLTALPADVFDGLTGLQTLRMYNNSLDTLPEDLFDGLSSLQTLEISENALTTLPADVFDGLAALEQLYLQDNALTTLPADAFDGLAALEQLRLQNNSLAALPEDVFDGLTNLSLLRLNNNSLEWLAPDLFDGPSNLRELYLNYNTALACIHPGQFDGLSELRELHLTGTGLGNIAPTHASGWGLNALEELRFGNTRIASSTLNFQDYKSEFRDLVESRTYVRDPAELSDPICGAIRADTDGSGFHTIVRVNLEYTRVYPNRVREASTPGDGICGASTGEDRRKLWKWQRSDDGVTWTDMPSDRQPEGYTFRGRDECSFLYTPQADDNSKHVRAYVPVDTAGVGENNYHSAAFGPLNVEQP